MNKGLEEISHEQFLAGEEIKLGKWDRLGFTLERPKLKGQISQISELSQVSHVSPLGKRMMVGIKRRKIDEGEMNLKQRLNELEMLEDSARKLLSEAKQRRRIRGAGASLSLQSRFLIV